jgi:hypothetical protein
MGAFGSPGWPGVPYWAGGTGTWAAGTSGFFVLQLVAKVARERVPAERKTIEEDFRFMTRGKNKGRREVGKSFKLLKGEITLIFGSSRRKIRGASPEMGIFLQKRQNFRAFSAIPPGSLPL